MDKNISKLLKDMKTSTTFIERTDSTWKPWCVYWSPSTGDLLVGMFFYNYYDYDTPCKMWGKVTRYNYTGQLTQTLQEDNTGQKMFRHPICITENSNGDVVVSDLDAVVVTECGGRHRFSYTGHPSGSRLSPRGICTDPLSHILVCDRITSTVQMIDRNDEDYNINKLSNDMKITTTIIEKTESKWEPHCVLWSQSNGDLLVGMYKEDTNIGKVTRYNQTRELTQTIEHDDRGLELYSNPTFLAENNNGDIVVSDDLSAVVVTDREGRHRFSYTGHPSGSGLSPCGICTDALSHILVCDIRTNTIQIIDKNGQFLSYLLTKSEEIDEPRSLCYDINTHHLWVGSDNSNKLFVYRYITQQDNKTGKCDLLSHLSTGLYK
uniref:Tripartite motif-containing protein 3 n=1 Tax=Magallana gigas TaxID=29159 RepID=K1QSH4_MAGGI